MAAGGEANKKQADHCTCRLHGFAPSAPSRRCSLGSAQGHDIGRNLLLQDCRLRGQNQPSQFVATEPKQQLPAWNNRHSHAALLFDPSGRFHKAPLLAHRAEKLQGKLPSAAGGAGCDGCAEAEDIGRSRFRGSKRQFRSSRELQPRDRLETMIHSSDSASSQRAASP